MGRRSDVETEIYMALLGCQHQLFFQCLQRRRCRFRVWHFQKRSDATLGTGPRGRVEIFLVCQPWFPKMNLIVD